MEYGLVRFPQIMRMCSRNGISLERNKGFAIDLLSVKTDQKRFNRRILKYTKSLLLEKIRRLSTISKIVRQI